MQSARERILLVVFLAFTGSLLLMLPTSSSTHLLHSGASSASASPSRTGIQDEPLKGVQGAAFSPDGRLLATFDASTVAVRDLKTGAILASYSVSMGPFSPFGFSPDSKILALSPEAGDLLLIDPYTGKLLRTIAHRNRNSMAFSPDNSTLALGDREQSITLWNYHTGQLLRSIKAHVGWVGMLKFSPDGSLLACAGERDMAQCAEIWRVGAGELQCVLNASSEVCAIAFSPDSRSLALNTGRFPNGDYGIDLWDVRTARRRKTLIGHAGGVISLAYSPDGATLVAVNASGAIRIWDPRSGAILYSIEERDYAEPVTLSADTRLAAVCCKDGAVHLYDTRSGTLKYVLGARSLLTPQAKPIFEPSRNHREQMQALEVRIAAAEARRHLRQDPNARLRTALELIFPEGDARKTARVAREIKQALSEGADPNLQSSGTSALMFFAGTGDLRAVKDLVHRGVRLDLRERYGRTALLIAAAAHHPQIVQFLLEAGAEFKDVQGQSLLPLRGRPDALGAALIAALDDPRERGLRGKTPKEAEALRERWAEFDGEDTALVLLQLGALPNVRDLQGNTALQYTRSLSLMQALLAHGADINTRNNDGAPAFLRWIGQEDLVRFALEHGVDANLGADQGWTALSITSTQGYETTARLLLANHADPNITGEFGRTMLMRAISEGRLNVAKLLVAHGANLETKDNIDGWTALTYAVIHQDREAVRLLLAKRANVHVLTHDGADLLQILRAYGKEDRYGVAELLKKAGCVK
ncbi:MAG: repeat, subgroup [Chthonomonadales bacterium]|nr:repeat, subgroup [Chthonomonadales bacterium]